MTMNSRQVRVVMTSCASLFLVALQLHSSNRHLFYQQHRQDNSESVPTNIRRDTRVANSARFNQITHQQSDTVTTDDTEQPPQSVVKLINEQTQEETILLAKKMQQEPNQQHTTDEPPTTNSNEKMNVVLFYADDWSFSTLGTNNDYVVTPHLDQMAREGMLFTHNCVTTSICWQSRATLYTGQYSSKHRSFYPWKDITMYEIDRWKQTLYPLMMQEKYHTGFFGKYHHLGPPPPSIPTFTEFRSYQGNHYVERNGVVKHITQWNEEDGTEFLQNRPRHQPFFLTISFFATHAEDGNQRRYAPMNTSMHFYNDSDVPIPPTMTDKHWKDLPWFFEAYPNEGRLRYMNRYSTPEQYQHMMKNTYRMATEVDLACGRLMKLLDEQGVTNNTLIIFTTDNGNSHGQHGLAEKWYAYEESVRVPLVIKDPRMPKSAIGTKNDEFTLNIDLAPTILKAAGIEPPKVMQGRDMAELYLQKERAAKTWRKEFLYEYWGDLTAIPNSFALVNKTNKYIYWTDYNYSQFFDMKKDPLEEFDIHNSTKAEVIAEVRRRMKLLHESAVAGVPL